MHDVLLHTVTLAAMLHLSSTVCLMVKHNNATVSCQFRRAHWHRQQLPKLTCVSHRFSSCSVKRTDYLNTFEFLDKLAENLKIKMAKQPKLWSPRPLSLCSSTTTHINSSIHTETTTQLLAQEQEGTRQIIPYHWVRSSRALCAGEYRPCERERARGLLDLRLPWLHQILDDMSVVCCQYLSVICARRHSARVSLRELLDSHCLIRLVTKS